MNRQGRKTVLIGLLALLLGAADGLLFPATTVGAELPGYADLTGSAEPGPGWTDLFDDTGKVKDLFGGDSAAFIEDNISAGVATDMSILIDNSDVGNGTVQAVNDLGNVYAYRTTDKKGNIVLFTGVEHLAVTGSNSYIDIEFNQDKIQVWGGVPWKIHGQRTVGDLAIRINLIDGALYNVEFKCYAGDESGGYQILKTAWPQDGQACTGSHGRYAFCSGAPVAGLAATNADVWDIWGAPVTVPAADSFVEVGINVGKLLGSNPDYSSLTLRTPEDIAIGTGLLQRRD
jgi:hypothetical protein